MYYQISSRIIDVIFSLTAILLLSPIFIIIIFLLKISGEESVFYTQKRIGFQNKHFKIWKFTTMLKNSSNIGTGTITLRNDPRVTKIGKFLRLTKLNEIPQFFNLLNGTMTLVGPRPHMNKDFNLYSDKIRREIFLIKPGITGIGSIFYRDQELLFTNAYNKSKIDPYDYYEKNIAPHKGELELWYQKNKSLFLDFRIIVITILVVFSLKSKFEEDFMKNINLQINKLA